MNFKLKSAPNLENERLNAMVRYCVLFKMSGAEYARHVAVRAILLFGKEFVG